MLDILFWMLFLLTPLSMFFLLRVAGEQLNQISMVNLVTVALFAFSVLGTFPLFYQLDSYRVAIGITDKHLIIKVLFFSCLNIVVFLFGVIFIRRVLRLSPVPIISTHIRSLNKTRMLSLLLILLLVVFVTYLYLTRISQIAIIVAFTEGTEAAAIARSNMGNNFSGKYHRYSLVMHDFSTIVTLAFYAAWLVKKNLFNLVLFLVAFSISTFTAVMAIEKGPFVGLLMALFMVYYLVRKNGYVPKIHVLVLGVIVVTILAVFYIYFMGSGSTSQALSSLFSRAFAGSITPAYHYLEYFPRHHDFLMGTSFPNPGAIMPYTPFNLPVEIMDWAMPHLSEQGIVGSMPTVFWGEAYANFGYAGIPIVAFIMGVLVAILSYVISKLELNPLTIAFTVWLIFHLKNLSVTGFSGYLYDFYMIFVSAVVVIVLFTATKIGIRNNRAAKQASSADYLNGAKV